MVRGFPIKPFYKNIGKNKCIIEKNARLDKIVDRYNNEVTKRAMKIIFPSDVKTIIKKYKEIDVN